MTHEIQVTIQIPSPLTSLRWDGTTDEWIDMKSSEIHDALLFLLGLFLRRRFLFLLPAFLSCPRRRAARILFHLEQVVEFFLLNFVLVLLFVLFLFGAIRRQVLLGSADATGSPVHVDAGFVLAAGRR